MEDGVAVSGGGEAFGAPGIGPTMAAGDKDLVLRALGSSRVWATIGGGIVNEVFWPTAGRPQLRDLGFLVIGTGYWVEVKRAANYTMWTPDPACPSPRIVHRDERFTLDVEVVCDADRDVVLVRYVLTPTADHPDPVLAVHVLAAARLGGSGRGNDAWTDGSVLHAARGDECLAIVADPPFAATSVGFVGASDAWQDLAAHGTPTWSFSGAHGGNVALSGSCAGHSGVLALAFSTTPTGARTLAASSLAEGFEQVRQQFESGWYRWITHGLPFTAIDTAAGLAWASAMVLKVHEDVTFPGAIVASLATPWGSAHDDPGGYHLVWPRDCAESALALAAIGFQDDALRTLRFLAATQSPDGHWPQNFTPGGDAYWIGLQLDETALPVILAVKLGELGAVSATDPTLRAMVSRAASYLAAHGPASDQDRWEESAGLNPFTLAAAIAALAGAALGGWLDQRDADYALSLADWWNARVEDLVYVADSELDRHYGTAGHYERIAAPGTGGTRGRFVLANRGGEAVDRDRLVGLEFLALVRYGLRRADDPRIVDTVRIVDAELGRDVGAGPLYHRYQADGYGEHDDGAPFDGSGVGRLWPLLAGERGHFAVESGGDPTAYVEAMIAATSAGLMLPEQVWDTDPIDARRLRPGHPSGSAMPLVWAHAEFLKLLTVSSTPSRPDRITAVATRYAQPPAGPVAHVRGEAELTVPRGEIVIEHDAPFVAHIGTDRWQHATDVESAPIGLGRHGVTLKSPALVDAASIQWTVLDPATGLWEGRDHTVTFE